MFLLAPHRCYYSVLHSLLPEIKALAHITGGGFIENIPRSLPDDLDAKIKIGSWPISSLWTLIQQKAEVDATEMYRVFNMGIGMIAIVEPRSAPAVIAAAGQQSVPAWVIGSVGPGEGVTYA